MTAKTPSQEMRGLIHEARAKRREMVNVSIQTLRRWADAYDALRKDARPFQAQIDQRKTYTVVDLTGEP